MCGRFTLKTPASLLANWFREVDFPVIAPRYNIAPSQQVLALRQSTEDQQEAVWMRWGLIPSWAKDKKIGNQLINARSETASTKPAFRRAFKSQRCVILADGFYEWKAMADGKQPFFIQPDHREHPIFCFAGLWESWTPPKSETPSAPQSALRQPSLFEEFDPSTELSSGPSVIQSCTILTTSANDRMTPLHHRMPVILEETDLARWLSPHSQDPAQLESLLQPCPDHWLKIHPVSKRVNRPAFDDVTCTEPVEVDQDV